MVCSIVTVQQANVTGLVNQQKKTIIGLIANECDTTPTLMYCHTALMISGRLAVCMPSRRASLLVSLYCTGCMHRGGGVNNTRTE